MIVQNGVMRLLSCNVGFSFKKMTKRMTIGYIHKNYLKQTHSIVQFPLHIQHSNKLLYMYAQAYLAGIPTFNANITGRFCNTSTIRDGQMVYYSHMTNNPCLLCHTGTLYRAKLSAGVWYEAR